MTRPEKRRKIKEYEKELKFIDKHTPYRSFQKTNEFMLPKEELDLLIAGTHENKKLQERFDLAKQIYTRVDQLQQSIAYLRMPATPNKVEHPVHLSECSPDPHNEP